jgi:hypothetical protein
LEKSDSPCFGSGLRLLRTRRERPRRCRAAEQPDELASFQLVELHSVAASQGRLQDIELARISQRVSERPYNLLKGENVAFSPIDCSQAEPY